MLHIRSIKRIGLAGSLLIGLLLLFSTTSTQALSGDDFNPGNIMSDSIFFDGGTMTTGEIQTFLNSKVPSCDTNGTQPYGNTGMTRAQWSAANGKPTAPYACLRDVQHDAYSRAANAYCSAIVGGRKSSAQIIYEVGQACNVSQKVLIVLLQKEQSLVTDDWPWPNQYRSATGYGCPDTAPCDSEYYGYFNQVYMAARQFQRYSKAPTSFSYRAGRDNYVQYNPDAGCGGSAVFIENQATAGLYNYTPYQPNPGALVNLNDSTAGGTSHCGAYGNRNFWWYYNKWFGNPIDGSLNIPHADGTLVRPANSPTVYVIENGTKRSTGSLAVFQSWRFRFDRVKVATQGDIDLPEASAYRFYWGAIVKAQNSPNIYVIDVDGSNNLIKRSLVSWENFSRLGLKLEEVLSAPDAEISAIVDGPDYDISILVHPSGSLVRAANSPTVYFLAGGQRLSMSSLGVFTSHNFRFDRVKIATNEDMQLPLGPAIGYREGTLIKGTSPTVYITDIDEQGLNRRSFGTYSNFVGLGHEFSEVIQIPNEEFNGMPIGSTINEISE